MTARGRHIVAFAGQQVAIEWRGPAAACLVALLGGRSARDFEAGSAVFPATEEAPLVVTLRLSAVEHDGVASVALEHGDIELYRGPSLGTAALHLLQHALHHLIDRSDGGLVLHAALVGFGDGGVVLPGPSGSGKSMLAAWLASQGGQPLADEACYLPDGVWHLTPFPRAFCFKGPWAEPLGLSDAVETFRSGDVRIVRPEQIPTGRVAPGIVATTSTVPVVPRLLVFPRYQRDAPFALTPMRPARAAVRLFETVANARNLSDYGVAAVAGLVRAIPAFGLSYGHVDQLKPLLDLIALETGSQPS